MEPHISIRNNYLFIGGVFSLAFALFQVSAVAWPPDLLTFFGGPVKLQAENPFWYIIVCVLVGAVIATAGIYAFSGAGRLPRLPLLKTILVAMTVVYLLRGLQIFSDLYIIEKHPETNLTRFAVFSLTALAVGLIHLMGILRYFKQNRRKIKAG